MSEIAAHRAEIKTLMGVCDQAVQDRVMVFRGQLDADPTTVDPFLFKTGVPYAKGVCFSCGAGLQDACFGRCWRCSLAWRMAAVVPISADQAAAYDGARVVA